MRLLLVEDDTVIAGNTKILLKRWGFSTDLAETIEEGFAKIIDESYDCIILDRKLPDGDGITLIKKIRAEKNPVPILILTAKRTDEDVVEGLNLGADDYLAKPFDISILAARIKALIRRGKNTPLKPIIKIGNLEVNTNSAEVKIKGEAVVLSPKEYEILEYLALHPNQIVDRITLLTHAWGEEIDLFSNTVEVHMKYLRNKIGQNTIKTVRGKGYMLCEK